jgi:hypothetical protein
MSMCDSVYTKLISRTLPTVRERGTEKTENEDREKELPLPGSAAEADA